MEHQQSGHLNMADESLLLTVRRISLVVVLYLSVRRESCVAIFLALTINADTTHTLLHREEGS